MISRAHTLAKSVQNGITGKATMLEEGGAEKRATF